MRDGTPSGLSTISTGVPSGRYGMPSSGRMRAMTPLLPWRPAILSPTDSLRFVAAADLLLLLLEQLADHFHLPLGALFEQPQVALEPRIVALNLQADHLRVGNVLQHVRRQDGALLQQPLAAELVEGVGAQRLIV